MLNISLNQPSAFIRLTVLHNFFYKKQPKKSMATSLFINSTPAMARPLIKPNKRKQGQPIEAKKRWRSWSDFGA